jgi:catechol 2,3-dioxygenase-like lactoylglutathione lyase family enzyme
MTITELSPRPPALRRLFLAMVLAVPAVLVPCGRPAAAAMTKTAGTARHDGHVAFDLSAVTFEGGTGADRKAVAESIEQLLESWCSLDAEAYRSRLAPEVTRISRVTGIDRGAGAAVAALPREWEEYERPNGQIAVALTIRDAEIVFAEKQATAVYVVEVAGQSSIRWDFSDRWLVFQVFEHAPSDQSDHFQLLHQSIASDLDAPGDEKGFDFEFAVPVSNLDRAVAFYTPLLGAPEFRDRERAIFRAGGTRYVLDTTGLQGFAVLRPSMPNGYATIHVDHLDKAQVAPVKRFLTAAGDRGAIELDPSGNPFVLLEERFSTAAPAPTPPVFEASAASPPEPLGPALAAWLHASPDALLATLSPRAFFFDNSRENLGAIERGAAATRRRLARQWNGYDRSAAGISARLSISNLAVVTSGSRRIASYRAVLEGRGPHPFRDETLATDVIEHGKIAAHFAVRVLPEGLVREFDYSAYATENMRDSELFYRQKIGLGEPYSDEDWYGFWSRHAVFGLHKATRADDHFPVPRQANGHPSFWVASARKTYDYLKSQGSSFPVHPSINNRAGLDPQPGYIQVLSTDSEGNLLLFTEYTGR